MCVFFFKLHTVNGRLIWEGNLLAKFALGLLTTLSDCTALNEEMIHEQ
jgi:hypothetical protein